MSNCKFHTLDLYTFWNSQIRRMVRAIYHFPSKVQNQRTPVNSTLLGIEWRVPTLETRNA